MGLGERGIGDHKALANKKVRMGVSGNSRGICSRQVYQSTNFLQVQIRYRVLLGASGGGTKKTSPNRSIGSYSEIDNDV